jgi:hypothetical protein
MHEDHDQRVVLHNSDRIHGTSGADCEAARRNFDPDKI